MNTIQLLTDAGIYQEFWCFKGDVLEFSVYVENPDGTPKNLTGYTAVATFKKNQSDTNDKAVIGPLTGTISSPSTGIIEFNSSETDIDAREYWFDCEIRRVDPYDVQTVAWGKCAIIQDITDVIIESED